MVCHLKDSIKITLISTKTSLRTLYEAIKNVEEDVRCKIDLDVIYVNDLEKINIEEVTTKILKTDVLLLDVRGSVPEVLENAIKNSTAQLIIPLIGGSILLSYLKMGGLTGEAIAKRMRPLDFDADRLDMKKIFKAIDLVEKISRKMPLGFLRDYRNWIWLTRYWSFWGRRNLENMFRLILSEYLRIKTFYEEPIKEIDNCLYILDKNYCTNNMVVHEKPAVAIFLYGGMHFEQDLPVAMSLKEEFEKLGLRVLLIVGGSAESILTQLDTLKRFIIFRDKPAVDAVVNLQWFTINGGPYGGDVEPTRDLFIKTGCLLFNGLIGYMRRYSDWINDPRGLSPIEILTGVALPEIDGALEPIISAVVDDTKYSEIIVLKERVKKKSIRITRWIQLRYKSNKDKKVAIVIYNYPPGEENVGSAAYLDVFESLSLMLKTLGEAGYIVEYVSKEKLVERIKDLLVNSPRWRQYGDDIIRLSLEEYLRYYNTLPKKVKEDVEKIWGPPPGEINVDNKKDLVIPGLILGNVFIGVQPSRGFHDDPKKLYHSKDLPPHHQYIAFYHWIRDIFKADLIIHLGTHGTLELLPGKEVGLTENCWPDILIGDVPHVYIYHVTNPSEMTIAKRRGYAYIITHGTPPFTNADLYGEYSELEQYVSEYMEETDDEKKKMIYSLINERCVKLNLDCKDLNKLHNYLYELKKTVIPKGLHVLGRRWSDEEIIDYIFYTVKKDGEVKALTRLLIEEQGLNYDLIASDPSKKISDMEGRKIIERAEKIGKEIIRLLISGADIKDLVKKFFVRSRDEAFRTLEYIKDLYERIRKSDELSSLIKVLNGEYIEPRVAGDPIRTPEIFPTGSHGYAFDPRLIPSKSAYMRGARLAEQILRRYIEKYGRYPETISFVLWGFETAQTRGETIGMILQLLGVRLIRDKGPWNPRLEIISLEELGRPRIDVVITICGFFRDMFPNLISLLDKAVKLVARLDEPLDKNYIRKHYLRYKDKIEDRIALARIFGPKPGVYGTRLPEFIETSEWSSEKDLVDIYLQDIGYVYTDDLHGFEARDFLLEMLKNVDLVGQIRSSSEYDIGDLDHYYEFLGGLKRTIELLSEKKIETLWIDTTGDKESIKDVKEAIDLWVRARLLNPKWINSMLDHGYDGAREIMKRIEYVLGHTVLTKAVDEWIWNEIVKSYVLNQEIRERFMRHNPWALHKIIERIYEAYRRGYWRADEKMLREIEIIRLEIERSLE